MALSTELRNLSRLARIGLLVAVSASCWTLLGAPLGGDLPRLDAPQKAGDLDELSLEELLNVTVTSASNTAEKLQEAPATVVVISQREIQQRGYTELSQILDDLPGMQVSRSYGDYYVKDYWRGYRNYLGEPFLLMVDGITFNHLYYNSTEMVLAALPLSNVERIEIVYGPASAVYGANALMGVINLITRKDLEKNGFSTSTSLTIGQNQLSQIDASVLVKEGKFRFGATFRLESSRMDDETNESYEYTKGKYYSDRRLWGGFVDDPDFGGSSNSRTRRRAVDLRAFLNNTELAFQYVDMKNGYGNEYSADLVQNAPEWRRAETSFHLRHLLSLTEKLASTTTIRYRESDVPKDSAFLDGYYDRSRGSNVVAYSYWQTLNNSWTVLQDFDYKISSRISFNFGLKFERKDLQKAYDNPYGPYLPASQADLHTYPFPSSPPTTTESDNRITTEDWGAYAQGRFRLDDHNILVVGGRWDHNSIYKGANTLRLGYVGNFHALSVKALYGEGFQEPTPRTLYGSWRGSGAFTDLRPEYSRTLEFSAVYTKKEYKVGGTLWDVRNIDTIIAAYPHSLNLGKRNITGLDVNAEVRTTTSWAKELKLWLYYSRLLGFTGSNDPDENGAISQEGLTPDGRIGDLAANQLWLGLTSDLRVPLTVTLLGRYVGPKDTVATNPVGTVDGYTTLDLALVGKDLLKVKGLSATFKVWNLVNSSYFHTGLSSASAGVTPGHFDESGAWIGSGGYYSSLLAQPGRAFTLAISFSR